MELMINDEKFIIDMDELRKLEEFVNENPLNKW